MRRKWSLAEIREATIKTCLEKIEDRKRHPEWHFIENPYRWRNKLKEMGYEYVVPVNNMALNDRQELALEFSVLKDLLAGMIKYFEPK